MSTLRTKKHEEVDAEGSWAISYGDMITVLLAFFVMFFSVDFKDEEKELINSSLIESLASREVINKASFSKKKLVEGIDVDSSLQVKQIDKDNILVFFKGKSFFKSGKTKIIEGKKKLITDLSSRIMPFLGEFKVVIQAYTDSAPVLPGWRFKDNTELAMLRSLSVMKVLIKDGVDSDRIEITGKGILSPAVLDHMGISSEEDEVIKNMQRTVSFVLRRSPLQEFVKNKKVAP